MQWDNLATALAAFHFLRPWWFVAIIPAIALCWLNTRQDRHSGEWSSVIASELLPYMLDGAETKRRNHSLLWLFGWTLAVTALAGPTWKQIPLPVHKQESALVILFDLSPSMLAQDVAPDRLTRARLKLVDILNQRREGTTALVAYSGDAFTVSPLTDDAKTVAALAPALHPGIMPAVGSNTEAAVARALELLRNAGQPGGDILIITDDISPTARTTIDTQLRDRLQIDVSILAVGTADGAPIPLGNGSFAKDSSGAIVVPALNAPALKKLAKRLGGRYCELTADDRDIDYLIAGFDANLEQLSETLETTERNYDSWDDQGFWLAIICLPLLLLGFRRGAVASLLFLPLLYAPQPVVALEWRDLWQRQDQQASDAFQRQNYGAAKEQFQNRQWQAASAYKNGDYHDATRLFDDGTATADYNRGNTLAKAGKLEQAIDAYQQALDKQPDMQDAQFNKELVEKLLQQQNQQQNAQSGQNQNGDGQQQNAGQPRPPQQQGGEQGDKEQQNPQAPTGGQPSDQGQNHQQGGEREQQQGNPQSAGQESEQPPQQQDSTRRQAAEQPSREQPASKARASQPEQPELSDEQRQAMEQWLRRIPDDPGGLLRKKFRYEADKRANDRRRGYSVPQPPGEQRW